MSNAGIGGNAHLRCRSYIPGFVAISDPTSLTLVRGHTNPKNCEDIVSHNTVMQDVCTYSSWLERLRPIAPVSVLLVTLEMWSELTMAPGMTGFFPFTMWVNY